MTYECRRIRVCFVHYPPKIVLKMAVLLKIVNWLLISMLPQQSYSSGADKCVCRREYVGCEGNLPVTGGEICHQACGNSDNFYGGVDYTDLDAPCPGRRLLYDLPDIQLDTIKHLLRTGVWFKEAKEDLREKAKNLLWHYEMHPREKDAGECEVEEVKYGARYKFWPCFRSNLCVR